VVVQHLGRQFVVRHRGALVRIRFERRHARGLVRGPIGLVHLQIQHVVRDEREEHAVQVQPDAAEHAPRRNPADARKLLDHVVSVLGRDGHQEEAFNGC